MFLNVIFFKKMDTKEFEKRRKKEEKERRRMLGMKMKKKVFPVC